MKIHSLAYQNMKQHPKLQKNAAVKVVQYSRQWIPVCIKVVILAKLSRYDKLRKAMNAVGVTGMTVTQVMGCGIQKGSGERYRGVEDGCNACFQR